MSEMEIINEVKELLGDKLILYQVGGSVRDEIMGRIPKDYDFATPQLPDEIEEAIRQAGRKPHTIGKRFGTISLSVEGQIIEITTFRNEKYTEGNRKPEVNFIKDLKEDLSRRDFTINAIAKDMDGNLFDPFNGRLDIYSGVIRCVGKPKKRFGEDPLRILRGARFASQFNFKIEDYTKSYMEKMSPTILNVSKERWGMELDKILISENPRVGLEYLMDSRIFNFIIPYLSLQKGYNQNSRYHDFTLWEHTLRTVENVDNDILLRWGALLHDIAKPFVARVGKKGYTHYIEHEKLGYEIVFTIGDYLRWSVAKTNGVAKLVLHHLERDSPLYLADNKSKKEVIM